MYISLCDFSSSGRSIVAGVCRPEIPALFFFFFFTHIYFLASGQAVVTGVAPSSPRPLPSIFILHRVQQSHCSSIFHRVLLTRALALSASQFVHNSKSQRIYTSMHSAGLELTKLTFTRLEDNLIRHRGDRPNIQILACANECLRKFMFRARHSFHSCQILSPLGTGFKVYAHRLPDVTLLTL